MFFPKKLTVPAAALAMAIVATGATAQGYPSKPIRLIVASAVGTQPDVVARVLSPEWGRILGQPVIVENKPGASESIAYEFVAKQVPADGYTVSISILGGLATLPAIMKDLRFDPLKDLPPFLMLGEGRVVLVSPANTPWQNFDEMISYAKVNPGKLNYAATSPIARFPVEAIKAAHNLNIVQVLYSTGSVLISSVVAGDVQLAILGEVTGTSFGEKAKVLAVSGDKRPANLPNTPSFGELGLPQIRGISNALHVRAGTPKEIIDRLHSAASLAVQQPAMKAQFSKLRLEVIDQSQEYAARKLAEEAKFASDMAKKIGIIPQ